jgi:hypothetical protein
LEHDATVSYARLVEEISAENRRLAGENIDLAGELEKCERALSQAQAKKSEDTTNCASAEHRYQREGERPTPALQRNQSPADGVLAPISSNVLLPSGRIENGDSKYITLEKYHSLVAKYNLVFQNWTDIKAVRAQLETSLRAEKDKAKKYNQVCERLEKKLGRNRDKIQQLEEKVRYLEGENRTSRSVGVVEAAGEIDERAGARVAEGEGRNISLTDAASPALIDHTTTATGRQALDNPIITPNPAVRDLEPPKSEDDELKKGHSVLDAKLAVHIDEIYCQTNLPELHHSSQTDGDETLNAADNARDQSASIKTESPEDRKSLYDSPVVVQERCIKKRKARKGAAGPTKVKYEAISSSPIGLAAFHGLESHESIDLDDIGSKQMTPRKRRSMMQKLSRAIPHGSRSGRRSAPKNIQETESDSPLDSMVKDGQGWSETVMNRDGARAVSAPLADSVEPVLPRTSTYRATKRRRLTSDIVIDGLLEDGESLRDIEGPSNMSETSDHSDGRLMQLLENPTPTSRAPIYNSLATKALAAGNQSKHIPVNAIYTPTRRIISAEPRTNRRAAELSTNQAIAAPLSHYGKAKDVTPDTRRTPPVHEGGLEPWEKRGRSAIPSDLQGPAQKIMKRGIGTPQPPKTANDGGTTPGRPSSTRRNTSRLHVPWPNINGDAVNKPLRARPLGELRLGDFKVNPQYNHGYDYAFTDVVRDQEARRCLPGCTKPECCGNVFRALAEAARDPNKPPTASQDEADMRILKEFLGDNAHKIRNMSKAEKDETLLQARTRELANKHGKHRHAYERRQSPPGFWRLDFPSTQEERDDRRKIEQHEQDLVAQRYREAMRPGGAYVFRDE